VVAALALFASVCAAEIPFKPQTKAEDAGKEFEILLALARGQYQETSDEEETKSNLTEALAIYRQMIELGASGNMRREAFWGAARCCFRLGRLWEAFEAIEQSFPPAFEPQAVAERVALEYQIAVCLMRYGAQQVPDAFADDKPLTGYEAASRVFRAIVYNDARAAQAPLALLGEGDCLGESGDWQGAQKAYRRFLREHPRHELAAEAKAALARALVVSAAGGKSALVEEAAALAREAEAQEMIGERLRIRLEAYRRARQETLAADLLAKADFYLRQKTPQGRKSGVFTLREVMRQFPATKAAQQAARRLAECGEAPAELCGEKVKAKKEEP